jgi:hypothetical protein
MVSRYKVLRSDGRSKRGKRRLDGILLRKGSKNDESGSWRVKSRRYSREGYGSIRRYFEEVNRVADKDAERMIFIDTCQIYHGSGPQGDAKLFLRYQNALRKVPSFLEEKKFSVIREDMGFYSIAVEDLVKRENVVVIQGVKDELAGIFGRIIERVNGQSITSILKREAIEPISRIYLACRENYLRNVEYEADPLTKRLFDLIPKNVVNGNSEPPSFTDRRIIALALERGLVEGGRVSILSADGAIAPTLKDFYRTYLDSPEVLKIGGFASSIEDLERVDIEVGWVSSGKNPRYKTAGRYSNFFGN